jgi:hypothetical protein
MSPNRKWQSCLVPVKSVPDLRMLDLLLGENIKRKVGKKGIALDGCRYQHIELIELIGSFVHLLVPSDMGQVIVYDQNMKFVCIAEDIEHMGENRYKAKAAKKKSIQLSKKYDSIIREIQRHEDISILDRVDAKKKEQLHTPASTKSTPVIDRIIRDSKKIEESDNKSLKKSKTYGLNKKTKTFEKILPSGRPAFKTIKDRFLWVLEHDCWNEKDNALKTKYSSLYELAKEEHNLKTG